MDPLKFARSLNETLKFSAHETANHFVDTIASHPDHGEVNSNARMIGADALDEAGREKEAALLRSPHDVHVFNGRITRTHPEDIRAALQGYQNAALWSTPHYPEGEAEPSRPLDEIDHKGFHPATHAKMLNDITNFLEDNHDHIPPFGYGQTGHDLWMSRQGHGVGFFDGEEHYGESADHLQEQARKMGEFNLELGDDGFVHGY